MLKKYLLRTKTLTVIIIFFTLIQSLLNSGIAIIFQIIVNYSEMAKRQSISIKLFILSIIFLFVYILIYIMSNFFRRYFRTKLIIKIDTEVKSDSLKLLLSKELVDCFNFYNFIICNNNLYNII